MDVCVLVGVCGTLCSIICFFLGLRAGTRRVFDETAPTGLIPREHHEEVVRLLQRLSMFQAPTMRDPARRILTASGLPVPTKACPGGKCGTGRKKG